MLTNEERAILIAQRNKENKEVLVKASISGDILSEDFSTAKDYKRFLNIFNNFVEKYFLFDVNRQVEDGDIITITAKVANNYDEFGKFFGVYLDCENSQARQAFRDLKEFHQEATMVARRLTEDYQLLAKSFSLLKSFVVDNIMVILEQPYDLSKGYVEE